MCNLLFIVIQSLQVRLFMSARHNENNSPLIKMVYSHLKVNGKSELVALELYADGSLKRSS